MNNFTIITDSSCDLPQSLLDEWDVKCLDLTFYCEETPNTKYKNCNMKCEEFYKRLRSGHEIKTSGVNFNSFFTAFADELKNNKAILYIGISSCLSESFNSSQKAKQALLNNIFPDSEIYLVDSLSWSAGLGMLVSYAVKQRNKGATANETHKILLSMIPNIRQYFVVDKMDYLKRDGTVNSKQSIFTRLFNKKTILKIRHGSMSPIFKTRGKQKAIEYLAHKYLDKSVSSHFFISHSDCEEDANALDQYIFNDTGHHADLITNIGPVNGAHSGPGTLALFFMKKQNLWLSK